MNQSVGGHYCQACNHGNNTTTTRTPRQRNAPPSALLSPSLPFSSPASIYSPRAGFTTKHRYSFVFENSTSILPPDVAALNRHNDTIAFCQLLHQPLLQDFLIIPKTEKAKNARRTTFRKSSHPRLKAMMARRGDSKRNSGDSGLGSVSFDNVVTQSDIESPDRCGWLCEIETGVMRWCVLADLLFCVFENKADDVPIKVVLLSGSKIIRVLYNSAKRDVLTPVKSDNRRTPRADLTISGVMKYQFLIEDSFTQKRLAFAADSEPLLDEWILLLKLASKLDMDVYSDSAFEENDPDLDVNHNESIGTLSHKTQGQGHVSEVVERSLGDDVVLEGYTPTVDSRNRLGQNSSCCSPLSGICNSTPNCRHFGHTKGSAFTKISRCRTCVSNPDNDKDLGNENEALSISTSDSGTQTKEQKLKRKISSETIKDILKRKTPVHQVKTMIDYSSKQRSNSIDAGIKKFSLPPEENNMLSLSLPASLSEYTLQAYSTNLDFSSSYTPGIGERISRKASSIRGKFLEIYRKRSSGEQRVILGSLYDPKHQGYLLHKHMLKWTRVWCVIQEGRFFMFKSNDDEDVSVFDVPLLDCSILVEDTARYGEGAFKVCYLNTRGLIFLAETQESFEQWLGILKEQSSTYESFESSPRPVSLTGTSNLDSTGKHDSRYGEGPSQTLSSNKLWDLTSPLSDDVINSRNQDFSLGSGAILHSGSQQAKDFDPSGSYTNLDPDVLRDSGKEMMKGSGSGSLSGYDLDRPRMSECSTWALENYFSRHYLNHSEDAMNTSSESHSTLTESISSGEHEQPDLTQDDDLETQEHVHNNYTDSVLSPRSAAANSACDVTTRNSSILNTHLPGPNNEGLLLVCEDDTQQHSVSHRSAQSSHQRSPVVDSSVCSVHQGAECSSECTHQMVAVDERDEVELQKVRRQSLSDNNLSSKSSEPRSQKFHRSFSLTRSLKRRKKDGGRRPPTPQQVAAAEVVAPLAQGFLERCSRGSDWERVWCVLKDNMLYIYGTPEDDAAHDSMQLDRCTFRQYVEGYRDQQYVVEIKLEANQPEFIATGTEEEMASWLQHLKDAAKTLPGDQTTDSMATISTVNNTCDVLPPMEWKENPQVDNDGTISGISDIESPRDSLNSYLQRELLQQKKQQLLQEVLMYKQQLEQSQGKSQEGDLTCSPLYSPAASYPGLSPLSGGATCLSGGAPCLQSHLTEDERRWKQLVLLKQRRMSTELKLDCLTRALYPSTALPNNKGRRKSKVRLSLDLKLYKAKTPSELTEGGTLSGRTPEEVSHWESQLDELRSELCTISEQIEQYESGHKWYSGILREKDSSSRDPRSVSLLSERGLMERGGVLHKSCENLDEPRPKPKLKPQTSVGSVSSWKSVQSAPGLPFKTSQGGQSRLQKLTSFGKKFPTLSSFLTKRGRKIADGEQIDIGRHLSVFTENSADDQMENLSPEITEGKVFEENHTTGDNSGFTTESSCSTPRSYSDLVDVPPNSRDSLTGIQNHPEIPESSLGSLLTSVMSALDNIARDTDTKHCGYAERRYSREISGTSHGGDSCIEYGGTLHEGDSVEKSRGNLDEDQTYRSTISSLRSDVIVNADHSDTITGQEDGENSLNSTIDLPSEISPHETLISDRLLMTPPPLLPGEHSLSGQSQNKCSELNLDIDSGRGSPMTPDMPYTNPENGLPTKSGPNSPSSLAYSEKNDAKSNARNPPTRLGVQNGRNSTVTSEHHKPKREIKFEALRNIAAFEELLKDRLGYF